MIFAVGVIVGIVAIGHDNHSNYSDYSDYSEYGDSYLMQQVEEAKAKKNQAKRNLYDFCCRWCCTCWGCCCWS